MAEITIIPVGRNEWGVVADHEILVTVTSRSTAQVIAEGLAAKQQVLNLYDTIFSLQDTIQELTDALAKKRESRNHE